MQETIFLPKTIRVGYQKRSDTYTNMLAYVIYYDQKGTVRKERSWESWRDKKIEPTDFENIPTEGFVLNKKAGGYAYSHYDVRQTYCRIYDPRGFEFEITIPNLLYILENTNSIKGKGLEGTFVYGWLGSDIILIPTSSPDYAKIAKFTEMVTTPEKITTKDLIFGGTYRTNKNEDWIYLGKFDEYETSTYGNKGYKESKGKKFYFIHDKKYETLSSISGRIVKTVSNESVENYAELMDELECKNFYSPIDEGKDEYVDATQKDLDERKSCNYSSGYELYYESGDKKDVAHFDYANWQERAIQNKWKLKFNYYPESKTNNSGYSHWYYQEHKNDYLWQKEAYELYQQINPKNEFMTMEELNSHFHFKKLNQYLMNGKLFKRH